jgi:hypothetical protein
MSSEQRMLFFLHCGLPTNEEWQALRQLLEKVETRKAALLHGVSIHETVYPTDKAAFRFSELHPTDVWGELDAEEWDIVDPNREKDILDYWGDVHPLDPSLVQVVEELGESCVCTPGKYSIVEVPAGLEYDLYISHHMPDEYNAEWYQYLVPAGTPFWTPSLG